MTQRVLLLAVVVLTAPVWLALLVVVVLGHLIWTLILYALVWGWWIGRTRRRVLFVYSESPHWKDHIETTILPQLPANSVVLNWSHRLAWNRFDVPVILFRGFAGTSEFNPIGLVFERFSVVKRYRFWQAFREARHGRPDALRLVEREFLEHVAG